MGIIYLVHTQKYSKFNSSLTDSKWMYAFKNPHNYTYVWILVILLNLMPIIPIYLFYKCYLFKINKLFGKCKWWISIHVKSKINNVSALVGIKDCKKTLWSLAIAGVQLPQDYRATSRRQFTFCHLKTASLKIYCAAASRTFILI